MKTPRVRAVVIGTSAGAVQALLKILPALPADYPFAVLIAVHVPADRANALVTLLQKRCAIRIKEAEDKEAAIPACVYFAPPDYHLLVEQDGSLALSSDEPVNYSRPSIDVLFESAADAFGEALTGVILTGANHDGAHGLHWVCERGGDALVEEPSTAYAGAMPTAALAACPNAQVLNLEAIALSLAGRKT